MEANTVIFTSADGMVQELPLDMLIERKAVIADKVNGDCIAASMGAVNQLWVPGLPAKYFIRDIVSIEFEKREAPPSLPTFEDDGHDYTNRPNISLATGYRHRFGNVVDLHGWADDYDRRIVAVELSVDNGLSWRTCATSNARAGALTFWRFAWVPESPGAYKVMARAVNEDGKASPIPAAQTITISEPESA